jgi:hypothetical protein
MLHLVREAHYTEASGFFFKLVKYYVNISLKVCAVNKMAAICSSTLEFLPGVITINVIIINI